MSVVTRIRTSQELTVPFTPEEVWAVLADVAAYPEWWPGKLAVEILYHPGELLGAEFEVRPVMGRMFRIRFEELEDGRSMRLRFFGGSLEGPGGFHLLDLDGATQVRYEMDVFARGLDVAVMSQVLPLEHIHRSRMRSVLNSLAARLKKVRKAAGREEAEAARAAQRDAADRLAAEAAARRAAEEAAALRAAEQMANRRAEEAAAVLAMAEEAKRRAAEEKAARLAAEEAERRRAEEEAARLAAQEAARKKAEEEAAVLAAAEEAKRRAAEEEAAQLAAEEAERRRAEEEAARLAAEEAERKRAEEEAARLVAAEAERRRAEEAARKKAEEAAAAREAVQPASEISGDVDHVEPVRESTTGSRLRPLWARLVNWLREAPAADARPSVSDAEPIPPPLNPGASNFDIARLYLEALSSQATPDEIGQFFAPEAVQLEFPHRFLETAVTRTLPGILEARASALVRFSPQRYDLLGATGGGSQVAMELRWKGRVAATGEGYVEGQELEARIAFFLKFAEGKIVRQRIHTCFEPWSTKAERSLTLDERVAQAGQSVKAPLVVPIEARGEPGGSNFEVARRYLEALDARADAETIARFYAPDAVQDVLPHRFLKGGAHRDLQAIKLARTRGLALMASESHELVGATGGGSQVALEVAWSGVVGEGLGLFTPGQKLETRLAIFLKFRDGLIVAQRNYDCA